MTEPVNLDPVAVVQAAAVQVEEVPGYVRPPNWSPENPETEPVTVAGHTRLALDLDALPDLLKSADGRGFDLAAAVATLWQLLHSLEVRSVTGAVVLTSKPVTGAVWGSGQSADLAVTWSSPPPKLPTGATVSIEAGVAWMGKTTAVVKQGSITEAGCTITVKNVGAGAVVPSAGQPITYTVQGIYLHTPPLTS